jgi:hypothetical protein
MNAQYQSFLSTGCFWIRRSSTTTFPASFIEEPEQAAREMQPIWLSYSGLLNTNKKYLLVVVAVVVALLRLLHGLHWQSHFRLERVRLDFLAGVTWGSLWLRRPLHWLCF